MPQEEILFFFSFYPLNCVNYFIFTSHRCSNASTSPQTSVASCPKPVSSAFLSGPSSSGDTSSSLSGPKAPGGLASDQMPTLVTGARKAKVLYDYDAHDGSELSLLADEVECVHYLKTKLQL